MTNSISNTAQIATHLREVHFGGNWTWVNLRDTLKDISRETATKKITSFNTIAALTYHINYYVTVILKFLQENKLDGSDKLSFDVPDISSEAVWQDLQNRCWRDAEQLAKLIEVFPDNRLSEIFFEEKYGNYFRNFHGLIEHCHYHLGQIVILKKIITSSSHQEQKTN